MASHTSTGSDELSKNEKATILMQKFQILRQETTTCIINFKAHVKHVQIMLTAIVAVLGIAVGKVTYIPITESKLFWVVLMFFGITVITFVALDVIDSIYSMNVVGIRLRMLEAKINKLSKETLLIWESTMSHKFHGSIYIGFGIFQPGPFLFLFEFLMIAFGLLAIPSYLWLYRWDDAVDEYLYRFRAAIVVGFLYSCVSLIWMIFVAVGVVLRLPRRGGEIASKLSGSRRAPRTQHGFVK